MYDEWLQKTQILVCLVVAVASVGIFNAVFPSIAASGYFTPAAYGIGLSLAVWRGKGTIFGPLHGRIAVLSGVLIALMFGIAAFVCEMIAPQVLCLSGDCSSPMNPSLNALQAAAVFFVAPAFETIVLQGWIQTRTSEIISVQVGIVLTTILFIGMHFELSVTLVLIALGLSIVRYKTQSLLVVAAAHAFANLGIFASHLAR